MNDHAVKYWSGDAAYEVESFYRQSGFFLVKVEANVSNIKEDKNSWLAVLRVSEGPHYRFGKISVVIVEDSMGAFSVNKLKAREGEPYVEEDLSLDQRQITRVLGNAGFVRARVAEESIQKDSLRQWTSCIA